MNKTNTNTDSIIRIVQRWEEIPASITDTIIDRAKCKFYWHLPAYELLGLLLVPLNEQIKAFKEADHPEIVDAHLRVFTPVLGNLPAEVTEAGKFRAYTLEGLQMVERALAMAKSKTWEARSACVKARQDREKSPTAYYLALEAWDTAVSDQEKIERDREIIESGAIDASIALKDAIKRHMDAIEELHRQEHPDCPLGWAYK